MSKKCKLCKYKLNYDNLRKKYESQEDIIKILLKNQKLLEDIKSCQIDYYKEPDEQVIKFYDQVDFKIQSKGDTYRTFLFSIYLFIDILLFLFTIFTMSYAYTENQIGSLILLIPTTLFAIVMFMLHKDLKKKKESDAYNILMALISLIALFVSLVSFYK